MSALKMWSLTGSLMVLAWTTSAAESRPSPTVEAASTSRPLLAWTIDPHFTREALPAVARVWYHRLWAAINHANPGTTFTSAEERVTNNNYREMASSNDPYVYGRSLSNYVTSLLHVFRVTGDEALLAEVDRIAELMRAQLKDWSILTRGTVQRRRIAMNNRK